MLVHAKNNDIFWRVINLPLCTGIVEAQIAPVCPVRLNVSLCRTAFVCRRIFMRCPLQGRKCFSLLSVWVEYVRKVRFGRSLCRVDSYRRVRCLHRSSLLERLRRLPSPVRKEQIKIWSCSLCHAAGMTEGLADGKGRSDATFPEFFVFEGFSGQKAEKARVWRIARAENLLFLCNIHAGYDWIVQRDG